jgi:hypothetical protein
MGAGIGQDTPGEGASVTEKMKEWQEKMLDAFRDSGQDGGGKNPDLIEPFQGLFIESDFRGAFSPSSTGTVPLRI